MIFPPNDLRRKVKLKSFDNLLTVMDELRLNCPWDKKQTNESLRHLSIEEVFELAEAITNGNPTGIKEELGDVLLHIVFYCQIAAETDQFDVSDVIDNLIKKLKYRHPHIYGQVVVTDEDEVKKNWESLKKKDSNKGALSGVPSSLPPMVKAMRIQEKARGAGFDWDDSLQVWEKGKEELLEFEHECKSESFDVKAAENELGDVFFSLINYARFKGLNPDLALERTNLKFTKRFNFIENKADENGKSLTDMTLPEMDVIWEEAKKYD